MSESLGRSIAVNKLLRKREGIFVTGKSRHPDAVLDAEDRKTADSLIDAAVALQAETCHRHWRQP